MTDPLDTVRSILSQPEDIDMEGVGLPDAGPDGADWQPDFGDPGFAPDFDGPDMRGPADPGPGEDDPIGRAARQPLNDYGNGQRLCIHFGQDLMFVPELGWHVWAGTHWASDPKELMTRARAQKIWHLIQQEAARTPISDDDLPFVEMRKAARARIDELMKAGVLSAHPMSPEREEFGRLEAETLRLDKLLDGYDKAVGRRFTWGQTSGNSNKIENMVTESKTDLQVPYVELDADPLEINTESGLLRFRVETYTDVDGLSQKEATWECLPHDRAQRLTKVVPVAFDPDAPSPLWDAFLARVQPDIAMRSFLQRWLGLSMSGLKTSHLAFFYGSGANGKSVLVDTIAKVLSGYSTTMKIESITGNNQRTGAQATPDLIPLVGARFVRVSEPDQGTPLQEGLVKAMTGGEPIPVRPNFGEQFLLDPCFKLTMSGNHKPDIRGGDDGIWRRVLLVPFDVQIPASERDEALVAKLWAERAGIFRWLVEGLRDYLVGGLRPPEAVLEATSEYREESDPMGAFLLTCCAVTGLASDTITAKRLGDAFNYYLLERNLNTWQATTVSKQLAAKSRQWRHPETGKQFERKKASVYAYHGIRLTDLFARRFDSAPRNAAGTPTGIGEVEESASPRPDYDF